MENRKAVLSRFADGSPCSNPLFALLCSHSLTKEGWLIEMVKQGYDNTKTVQTLMAIDFKPSNGVVTVAMLLGEPFMNIYRFDDYVHHAERMGFTIAKTPEIALLLRENLSDEELYSYGLSYVTVPFISPQNEETDQVSSICMVRSSGKDKGFLSIETIDKQAKYSSQSAFVFVKEVTTSVV
ncbi:MAG: hypothetical protein KBC98_00185 [Candidatus Pacebacteria bacterium]|nr:hypothetical protein [Candidatus Paceibacterota bacterium]